MLTIETVCFSRFLKGISFKIAMIGWSVNWTGWYGRVESVGGSRGVLGMLFGEGLARYVSIG